MSTKPIFATVSLLFTLVLLILTYILRLPPAITSADYIAEPTYDHQF